MSDRDRIEELEDALRDLYEFCAKKIGLESRAMRQARFCLNQKQHRPTGMIGPDS
jgi:hypothetical protein